MNLICFKEFCFRSVAYGVDVETELPIEKANKEQSHLCVQDMVALLKAIRAEHLTANAWPQNR